MNRIYTPRRWLSLSLLPALVAASACEKSENAAPPTAEAPAPEDGVALEGLGYANGSADAPVTVVEFSDFGCGYCAQFAGEVYPALHREFVETGQVRWQYVPFVLGIFPNGDEAARAGVCAAEQDRFWPMHDLLFERQRDWKGGDDTDAIFTGYARSLGLDVPRFAACLASESVAERVRRNSEAAEGLGVRATPSFLVNGRPVQGALPLDQFRMLLQWAGAGGEAGTQLAPGTRSPNR